MDPTAIQSYLLRLFERHDVELDPDEDGWLLTDDDFPAISAIWHESEGGASGRLDLDVVIGEERRIEDAFVGMDCREALQAFENNSFYLLLAACWYVTDDRRMRIAAWDIGVRTWDVFVGPLTVRGSQAGELPMPAEAANALKAAAGQLVLTPELHWLHLLHRRSEDGQLQQEALLDGEPWPAGTQALAAMAWPQLPPASSARQMVLMDVRDY